MNRPSFLTVTATTGIGDILIREEIQLGAKVSF